MSSTENEHSPARPAALRAAFPAWLGEDVAAVLSRMGAVPSDPLVLPDSRPALVDGYPVTVPYRVYFPGSGVEDIRSLTERQRIIHACLMTRHRDGHQREYWARVLCSFPVSWAAPYMAALLEDYVIQVLAAARDSFRPMWAAVMRRHAEENDLDLLRLSHRVLNHWSLYHRDYGAQRYRDYHPYHRPEIRFLTDYPGHTLARLLGLWHPRAAPKLRRKAAGAHPAGRVRLIDEPAHTFRSADNTRRYPVEVVPGKGERVHCVHGVLVDDRPALALGTSHVSGVHGHSLLALAYSVFIAVGSHVVRFTPGRPHPDWDLEVDDGACFGVHYHAPYDALLSHGELSITRFTREGRILWSAAGADIFSEGFRLLPDRIEAVDFEGRVYHFDCVTGALLP